MKNFLRAIYELRKMETWQAIFGLRKKATCTCNTSQVYSRCPRCKRAIWRINKSLEEQRCFCGKLLHKKGFVNCSGEGCDEDIEIKPYWKPIHAFVINHYVGLAITITVVGLFSGLLYHIDQSEKLTNYRYEKAKTVRVFYEDSKKELFREFVKTGRKRLKHDYEIEALDEMLINAVDNNRISFTDKRGDIIDFVVRRLVLPYWEGWGSELKGREAFMADEKNPVAKLLRVRGMLNNLYGDYYHLRDAESHEEIAELYGDCEKTRKKVKQLFAEYYRM